MMQAAKVSIVLGWVGALAVGCGDSAGPGGGDGDALDAITELTLARDAGVYSYRPDIYQELVVWAQEEQAGQADNVYLLDLGTQQVRQLTALAKPQGPAVVYGRQVVWVDARAADEENQNRDLYLLDLDSNTEHQVTRAAEGQYDPEIFAHLIVWRDDRGRGATYNGDIYAYDMGPDARFGTADDRGELAITTDAADQTAPDVYVSASGRAQIVWYDLRDDADGACASICDTNIYLYDFGADGVFATADDVGPTRVTSDTHEQESPTLWGRRIVWLDARDGSWTDPDIYFYDMGPDEVFGTADDLGEQRLPVDTREPGHLHLWQDRLVWEDYRLGSWEVWLYDFSTGAETQLTDAPSGQFYPRIWGDRVVWQDARNNDPEGEAFDDIYGCALP